MGKIEAADIEENHLILQKQQNIALQPSLPSPSQPQQQQAVHELSLQESQQQVEESLPQLQRQQHSDIQAVLVPQQKQDEKVEVVKPTVNPMNDVEAP